MTKAFIDEIKSKLFTEKERLEENLANLAGKSENSEFRGTWEQYGDKEEDNAAEVAAFTDSVGVEYELHTELARIKDAIRRIEDNSYGRCGSCKEDIDEKRLLVRPMSNLCIACQERFER